MSEAPAPTTDPFRWLFEDRKTGKIVIGQTPNLPLIVFACALATEVVLKPRGLAGVLVRGVKLSGLSYWAIDELVRGVNPFRRIGGASVLAYLIASRIG